MGTSKSFKKILIYSPYWHILGGGEKYLLDIAASLSGKHKLYIVADNNIREKALKTFGIDIGNVEFIKPEKFKSGKFYDRFFFLRQFDICFYMTDGSLFIPGASRNFLIIQSPAHIPKLTISTRFKISGWRIICYSSFMQKIIKEKFHKQSIVIPPAVDTHALKKGSVKKSKIILTVGRFFTSFLHEKRQDFLIDFFKENYLGYFQGWKLLVCGNLTEESGKSTLNYLNKKINKFPITLKTNVPRDELLMLYKKSAIYWHAAGFMADSEKTPEKLEHFGITTVEAMAAGCIPVVFSGGGQTDIVDDKKNGFLWNTQQQFLDINLKLIKDPKLLAKLSASTQKKSESFSYRIFDSKIYELI